MADFYAARDSTVPPLPWPSIAPPFSGVVSVHAGLASYDKLRDYPIIKTTEPYDKGDSCVREQKHFAAPDVLAFTSWAAEGPAPDVIERAAGGLVAEAVLEPGFGNGYVAVYRDSKWSMTYVLETQADLPDGLMGRYSSLSKLWATLGAYAEDVERNRQREEDAKPQVRKKKPVVVRKPTNIKVVPDEG